MPNFIPVEGVASYLRHLMEEAGQEGLVATAEILRDKVIPDIPIGDPDLDPHPEYALRNNVYINVYGHHVSVSVEGPYAVKQHEALHFKHPRGGRAKFLEANAIEIGQAMTSNLAISVKKTFASTRSRLKTTTEIIR